MNGEMEDPKTLKKHIQDLKNRLIVEPDYMERKILQARIDNLVYVQKQFKAHLTSPAHG